MTKTILGDKLVCSNISIFAIVKKVVGVAKSHSLEKLGSRKVHRNIVKDFRKWEHTCSNGRYFSGWFF